MKTEKPTFHKLEEIKREYPLRNFQFHLEAFVNYSGPDARHAGEQLMNAIVSGQWPVYRDFFSIELVKEI